MRRVISVWLPTWPTDRRQPGSPDDVPLVLSWHDGRRRIVAAADGAARALGLQSGIALAQAQAMVPGLAVMEAQPDADAQALIRLAAWCLRWSPLTAADPPDGLWIDATGCSHLHGGEMAMLRTIAARLARDGFATRLAVADTPGAAHALARYGQAAIGVVPPGDVASALGPLPAAALRLSPETALGLSRLGFDRVAQLAVAPRAPLARRFGVALLQRLDQALGRLAEPITPVLPPETIQHRIAFPEPLLTADSFSGVIALLVAHVCGALERAGQGARTLHLLFERVDGVAQILRIGLARPSRAIAHLSRLLDERLEEVDPGLGVEAMRLTVSLAEPLAYVQGGAENGSDIAALVDRLENRLGAHRVFRAEPVESDVPERAMRRVPALAPCAGRTWPPLLPRPVRLFSPPQPIEALSMLPDHPPVAFTWRRVRHRVRHADGPERIAGEWWRRDGEMQAVRDYWQVEDELGRRFWLYRSGGASLLAQAADSSDPMTGSLRWFLHGIF